MKTLPHAEKGRYRAILEVLYNASDPNALIDPYETEEHDWIDDVTPWPPADFGEIYTYTSSTHQRSSLEKG